MRGRGRNVVGGKEPLFSKRGSFPPTPPHLPQNLLVGGARRRTTESALRDWPGTAERPLGVFDLYEGEGRA
jgi:hypothetical protein